LSTGKKQDIPINNIIGILTDEIVVFLCFKNKNAMLCLNRLKKNCRFNMEREHQVDVWYVFFVLSVLGNRSIVVFMGVFCSRE
jgi:hypothetical protein